MTYKAIYLTISVLLLGSTAQALEICGPKIQGAIAASHAANVHEIYLNGKKIPVSDSGDFLLAFDRDARLKQELKILYKNEEEIYPEEYYTFTISPEKWDIQKVNGVAQNKVTPSEADTDEILRETRNVKEAIAGNTNQSFWKNGFVMPLEKYRVSGKFGGQRIINTIPKSPHRGMDLAAPEGTPVTASADGIVTLSGGDFFYSGNMVIIDHGQGLFTMYAHMKDVNVKKGERVTQGQTIGTVGQTGRATGPHLHWGASWNNIRFNPETLLELGKSEQCINI